MDSKGILGTMSNLPLLSPLLSRVYHYQSSPLTARGGSIDEPIMSTRTQLHDRSAADLSTERVTVAQYCTSTVWGLYILLCMYEHELVLYEHILYCTSTREIE
jgi:hypothetical protein